MLPTGIPGHRDPENVCTAFSPRPREVGDMATCDSDGHYLCDECCLKNPDYPEPPSGRHLNG